MSREVQRNGGRAAYRAVAAEARALENARRPKTCKLAREPKLRRLVASTLRKNWSPGQISGWLRARFSTSSRMYVSHETIYRTLFVQARGALEKELQAHLRTMTREAGRLRKIELGSSHVVFHLSGLPDGIADHSAFQQRIAGMLESVARRGEMHATAQIERESCKPDALRLRLVW